MCGRFSRFTGQDVLINRFGVDQSRTQVNNSYNVAPSTQVPLIFRENPVIMQDMKWGYIPFYAKDLNSTPTPINARDDSLHKSMYSHSFEKRRCLIPANGFYEWKMIGGQKQPFHIHLPDLEVFAFGGIYSTWQSPEGKEIQSFAIITTKPNEVMEDIHDRMPLIIKKDDEQLWLDYESDLEGVTELVKPYEGELVAEPVSRSVNSPRNDNKELIKPISEKEFGKVAGQTDLDDFF